MNLSNLKLLCFLWYFSPYFLCSFCNSCGIDIDLLNWSYVFSTFHFSSSFLISTFWNTRNGWNTWYGKCLNFFLKNTYYNRIHIAKNNGVRVLKGRSIKYLRVLMAMCFYCNKPFCLNIHCLSFYHCSLISSFW